MELTFEELNYEYKNTWHEQQLSLYLYSQVISYLMEPTILFEELYD